MIVFLHRKFSCERCISGHRSSTCEHLTASLVEIKGKGRPSTQCGHCKTRRSAAVGAHSKCVCGIVTAQVEGRKRVELHLTNGASLSFVASSPDELASVAQLIPGSSITLQLFRKDPRGKKQSPEPSDDGSFGTLESGNGDKDLVGRSLDVPLAKVGVTEEAVDVNWEQVLRNPCQCRFGDPCICSTISSSTSRARKKTADSGPHAHSHSPTLSDLSSPASVSASSPRARPASTAGPYVASGPPPPPVPHGGPHMHMGHVVFRPEQQTNLAHVQYVAPSGPGLQRGTVQSPYEGWPNTSLMPNAPVQMPVPYQTYQPAPAQGAAPYPYANSLPIAPPQYAYPYHPTTYQAYFNGAVNGTGGPQSVDPSGGAPTFSVSTAAAEAGAAAAYANAPLATGAPSPVTPTGHIPLTRHLTDLNLPSFSTPAPAPAPPQYGMVSGSFGAASHPVVQPAGVSCCSNPNTSTPNPTLTVPTSTAAQPQLTLSDTLLPLPICACGCFEPSSACDTCGAEGGGQCEEGKLWNVLGGGGGGLDTSSTTVGAEEEGRCGGGEGACACACSGGGSRCGCGSGLGAGGLQNGGGCCGSPTSGSGTLQNGAGCCGNSASGSSCGYGSNVSLQKGGGCCGGSTSGSTTSGALRNGGGCCGNSSGAVMEVKVPGFAVPVSVQATAAGSGGSCCSGSTPAPPGALAPSQVGGCCSSGAA